MLPIEWDKEYLEHLLDAVVNGRPIAPPNGATEWRRFDVFVVLGVFLFAASSHGPTLPQPDLSDEQREADEEQYIDLLLDTVRFLASVAAACFDGEYDDYYEPHASAVMLPGRRVGPGEGFRQ